jgi:hypothetical protein
MIRLLKSIVTRPKTNYHHHQIYIQIWEYLGDSYLILKDKWSLPVYWSFESVPLSILDFIARSEKGDFDSKTHVDGPAIIYNKNKPDQENYSFNFIFEFEREYGVVHHWLTNILDKIDAKKKYGDKLVDKYSKTLLTIPKMRIHHIICKIISYLPIDEEMEYLRFSMLNRVQVIMSNTGIIRDPLTLNTKLHFKTKQFKIYLNSDDDIYYHIFKYKGHTWLYVVDDSSRISGLIRFPYRKDIWSAGKINDLRRLFNRTLKFIQPINESGCVPCLWKPRLYSGYSMTGNISFESDHMYTYGIDEIIFELNWNIKHGYYFNELVDGHTLRELWDLEDSLVHVIDSMKRLRRSMSLIKPHSEIDQTFSMISKLISDIVYKNFTCQQFDELVEIEKLYRDVFIKVYHTVDKLIDPWTLELREKPLV